MDDEVISISSSDSESCSSSPKRTRFTAAAAAADSQAAASNGVRNGAALRKHDSAASRSRHQDIRSKAKDDIRKASALSSTRLTALLTAATDDEARILTGNRHGNDVANPHAHRTSKVSSLSQQLSSSSALGVGIDSRIALRERLMQRSSVAERSNSQDKTAEEQRTASQIENVIDEMLRNSNTMLPLSLPLPFAPPKQSRHQAPVQAAERINRAVGAMVNSARLAGDLQHARNGAQIELVADEIRRRQKAQGRTSDQIGDVIDEFLRSSSRDRNGSSPTSPSRNSSLSNSNPSFNMNLLDAQSSLPTPLSTVAVPFVKISRVQIPTLLAGSIPATGLNEPSNSCAVNGRRHNTILPRPEASANGGNQHATKKTLPTANLDKICEPQLPALTPIVNDRLSQRAAMQLRVASANALSAIAKFTEAFRRSADESAANDANCVVIGDRDSSSDSSSNSDSESDSQSAVTLSPVRPPPPPPPALPAAKEIVLLGEAVPNDYFGTVLMCSEFVLAFWNLLLNFKTEALAVRAARSLKRENFAAFSLVRMFNSKSNTSGEQARSSSPREPLSTMVMLFVLLLLEDEQYGGLTAFSVTLKELEVTAGNVCEIIRFLLLRTVRRYERSSASGSSRSLERLNLDADAEFGIRGDAVHDDELIEDEVADDPRKLRAYARLAHKLETCSSLDSLDVRTTLQLVDILVHRLLLCNAVGTYSTMLQQDIAEFRQRSVTETAKLNQLSDTLKRATAEQRELSAKLGDADATKDASGSKSVDAKSRAEARRIGKLMADCERRVANASRAIEAQSARVKEASTKLSEARAAMPATLRTKWLGTDRHRRRYWLFATTTAPGLFVESERIDIDDDEDDAHESAIDGEGDSAIRSQWQVYDNVNTFRELVAKLADESERDLQSLLLRRSDEIARSIAAYCDLVTAAPKPQDDNKDQLKAPDESESRFADSLQEFELRIRSHGLGGVKNFDAWSEMLTNTSDVAQMAESLTTSYKAVLQPFLVPPFGRASFPTRPNRPSVPFRPMLPAQRAQLNSAMRSDWLRAVSTARTEQRLHFLLTVLNAAVRWDKQIDDSAPCIVCKKRGDSDRALLCDECNAPYHTYCLQPPLASVPDGNWYCPDCAPSLVVEQAIEIDSESEADESASSSNESDTKHDCAKCDGMPTRYNPTIKCCKCESAYHASCEKSLRRANDRRKWVCTKCLGSRPSSGRNNSSVPAGSRRSLRARSERN